MVPWSRLTGLVVTKQLPQMLFTIFMRQSLMSNVPSLLTLILVIPSALVIFPSPDPLSLSSHHLTIHSSSLSLSQLRGEMVPVKISFQRGSGLGCASWFRSGEEDINKYRATL